MGQTDRRTVLRATGLTLAGATLTGCSGDGGTGTETATGTETTTGTATGDGNDLSIEHARLVESRPTGYREYTAVSDAEYAIGDVVWIYFEPKGAATEPADGEDRRLSLSTTLTLENADGETVETLADDIERTVGPDESVSRLFLFWQLRLQSSLTPGEYTAVIGVTDDLAGADTETAVSFSVTGRPASDYQRSFRTAITSSLDVEVQSLRTSGGVVTLLYETPETVGTEAGNYQIGFIAGRYARLVSEGWDVDVLRVETVDGRGDRYTWAVDSQTALDWQADRITTEEFTESVLATLSEV